MFPTTQKPLLHVHFSQEMHLIFWLVSITALHVALFMMIMNYTFIRHWETIFIRQQCGVCLCKTCHWCIVFKAALCYFGPFLPLIPLSLSIWVSDRLGFSWRLFSYFPLLKSCVALSCAFCHWPQRTSPSAQRVGGCIFMSSIKHPLCCGWKMWYCLSMQNSCSGKSLLIIYMVVTGK